MGKDINILLVEDDDVDAEILKRGLRKIGASGSLVRARDGVDALEILTQDAQSQTVPRPFVVLLDINMPRMNGHEFLAALRENEVVNAARVIVFTTSDNQKDLALAYKNNASGYIVKPNSSSELIDVLKSLTCYWEICEHPLDGV